ncbi:single-stranded-DNA-specific exonuclease RecJ [Gorillibacterium sp. sgz5001074]|uniref:single-stranded-DNA-specific exonuclease RecJ n=1 Tax=Gorillibacterium sp. sgz5001074 TaxID=3446695 RepID=UPI003F664421
MLEAKARWKISQAGDEAAERLEQALKLHPLVARLLVIRGITEVEAADRFLNGGAESFHDPMLLKGMPEAVARIRLALERGERIRIYGDYDADGISSTTLMIRLMERLGADYDTYIPHRVLEGYGLNRPALEQAKASGVSLVVTVDTGISARDEIEYARQLGLDVVVTDHHEPPELLPDAAAVVNPKQPGCPYPFKELAGVGVAFKLAQALLGEPPLEWLEIAAIGTVADLMPLTDENRVIVKLGLSRMRNTASLGLKALFGVAGIECTEVNETHIGFALAPRINASGRLQHANLAVKLLTTDNQQEAEHLAFDLDNLNKERQKLVDDMTKEAHAAILERGLNRPDKRVLVVAGSGWNVGVVGIVASRLLDKHYRPSIVLSIDPDTGMAKGSARSIAGYDIHHALTAASDLLDHFGGHQAAAGLSLQADKIGELEERLERMAQEWLTEEDLVPIMAADTACSLADANLACLEQITKLSPFGNGNPSPRFLFEGLRISEKRTMGKEQQHLKLVLAAAEEETAASIEAVGFGCGAAAERISPSSRVDVLGELSVNEWNGTKRPQIMIHDFRIPRPQVFDWRGTRVTGGGKAPALPENAGILIFAEGEEHLLPALWKDAPVWQCNGSGLLPVNPRAEREAYHELKDLVIFTLPPYEECMETGLALLRRVERIYAVFAEEPGGSPGTLPDRDAFKNLYALISRQEELPSDDERIWAALSKRTGLSGQSVRFMMKVFEELHFVRREGRLLKVVRPPAKRELGESAAYRKQMNRGVIEQSYIYSTSLELTGALLCKIASDG